MQLSITILTALLAVVKADSDSASIRWSSFRRHLSYSDIVGYAPSSQVTDQCAIDLDQEDIFTQLTLDTVNSFERAKKIYNEGGHSKSYALISLTTPLTSGVQEGDKLLGKNTEGDQVSGTAYENYAAGKQVIKFRYTTTDIPESYVQCQVGALANPNLKGCLVADGDVTIGGADYPYSYSPTQQNNNGRTIAGFSTTAGERMRAYKDFMYFSNYYGKDDYAHTWIESAFLGKDTGFTNGNADFALWESDGREQAIVKGTAYIAVFMEVIGGLEDALNDCDNNLGTYHSWDEAVCYYAGSLAGKDGSTPGRFMHEAADKRCADFRTCGKDLKELTGDSGVNLKIMDYFSIGKDQLGKKNCSGARETTKKIIAQMYIPQIQGALRYAYKVGALGGGEKEKGEAATFAAGVLPRIHAASPSAAKTICDSLCVGASSTDFAAVKKAFEETYADLGITCAEVGGFWFNGVSAYYEGMEPCEGGGSSPSATRGVGGGDDSASYRLELITAFFATVILSIFTL